jgi:hypothetical protein
MENWKVTEITLLARSAELSDQAATLPCAMVSLQSSSDIPAAQENAAEQGYLLAYGVPVGQLADVAWTPTHLRFVAMGYLEPREFRVTGWDADPQAGTVRFAVP